MNTKGVIDHIVAWLNAYAESAGLNGFVVGVSGGIDSAVTSCLAARTGRNLICVEMPIHQPADQISRARKHVEQLQSQFNTVQSLHTDLTPLFESFVGSVPEGEEPDRTFLALANTRARLRMTTLYYVAGCHHYLVAGTGNKVEDFGVGFYTKYGDGGVDLSPIADLMKTEVYALAAEMDVIEEIQVAAPTDGLWLDKRSDEDQIGASYPELEWDMNFTALNSADSNLTSLTDRQREVLDIYNRSHAANRHKMLPIPVCEIPPHLRQS